MRLNQRIEVSRAHRIALFSGLSAVLLTSLQLSGCGGSDDPPALVPMAQQSSLTIVSSVPGVTPFIHFVAIDGQGIGNARSFKYTVQAKAGHLSKAVSVTYALDYLARRGYASTATSQVTLPVFGLYAGHANQVQLDVGFGDGSSTTIPIEIVTPSYTDPTGLFAQRRIVTPRAAGAALGFDFFYMKSAVSTPVVVDTDGEIRWVAAGDNNSRWSIFSDNAFTIGGHASTELRRLELDGTVTTRMVLAPDYTNFHHTIDPGKVGLLAEFDAQINGQPVIEVVLAEIAPSGAVIAEWNFETLVSRYMQSQGDDPAPFVRSGIDWFHMNASMYDARDDTLIVSSRENFVIKVDYRTGDIIWVLGDPTKYWYTFPSLRAKSLSLFDGGLYPIGQHALSLTPDGLLLLFNNGAPSFNHPAGTSAGESRTFSSVSAYSIDSATRTAREVWRFDHGQSILSDICSSAYQTPDGSTLISYATAANRTKAVLVGLDQERHIVFEFEYPSPPCTTSWNAAPIAFDALSFK
jgi:arylsulfate sulfotransferase